MYIRPLRLISKIRDVYLLEILDGIHLVLPPMCTRRYSISIALYPRIPILSTFRGSERLGENQTKRSSSVTNSQQLVSKEQTLSTRRTRQRNTIAHLRSRSVILCAGKGVN